jgi:tyrosine-protein kinase Etk/Wzc
VAALAIGAIMVLKAQQIYQARGLLKIETSSGSLSLPTDMLGSGASDNSANAEIEIMKSRMVMTQAVHELDLQIYAYPRPLPFLGLIPARLRLPDSGIGALTPYQWGNETVRLGELEVPQDWLGIDMTLTITGVGKYSIILPDGSTAYGILRERLALPEEGFSLVVDELKGPSGREFLFGRMKMPLAISKLQRGFSVREAPPGSSILQVSYVGPDPRRAEAALNAIARSYVDQNIARSAAEAQNSLTFIEGQLPIAEVAVTDAQNALNAYRQEQQSVDVDYETQTLLQQSTQIAAQLNELSLQENELKERYTINHPVYRALLQKRVALEKQLEEVREATSRLPETQKKIFNLTRNLEVAQQVYVQLLNRGQELRVVRASTVGSVRIIDAAYSDDVRIEPRTTRTLMIYLLAGFVLSIGAVLLRHTLRRGIRGAQEIEQSGLPVFATVNYSPLASNLRKIKGTIPILALTNPEDLVIEALRSLRTSLHFGMLDAKTNTVLMTSAAPNAGKSFISVNLAIVAAQAGQRVCLVDADMRKGYLRRYLGKEKDTPGLAEILAREKTLDEVLVQGPVKGMLAILSGRFPPNPSELLMRAEFDDLLKTLDQQFDLIIVDSPPALAVTDPVVIGRYTGATIIVARHMETMVGEIDAVRGIFERAGVKVTGAILNGYKISEGSKYGGQYQYYNYRYDYKTERS